VLENCSSSSKTAGMAIASNISIDVRIRLITAASPFSLLSMMITLVTAGLILCVIFQLNFVN